MRMVLGRPLLLMTLLAGTALAGCASPSTEPNFVLTAEGVPNAVVSGAAFTFTLEISGDGAVRSEHIGAHYGTAPSLDASVAIYPSACVHQEGALPGTYDVTCTLVGDNAFFLRGHMRVQGPDGTDRDFWTEEARIDVFPQVELALIDPPGNVTVGRPFQLTLRASMDGTAHSEHVGAHFGKAPSDSPSVAVYPGGCDHIEASLPGEFTITCTINEAGQHYLRGHARLSRGQAQANHWSAELSLQVNEA